MKKYKLKIAILTLISNLALTNYGCAYQNKTTKYENNDTKITYTEENNTNYKTSELLDKLLSLNIGLTKDGKIILMTILESCNNIKDEKITHLHYVNIITGKKYIYEPKNSNYDNYSNNCLDKYEKLDYNFYQALNYLTYEEIDKFMTNDFSIEDLKNAESRLQEQYNKTNNIEKNLVK